MRKLIMEQWISLDGYAADANDELNFFPSAENNKFSDKDQLKFLESVDLIILGRKTYELFVDFWPTEKSKNEIIADKLNEISKVVFSNTLKNAPWGNYPNAKIAAGDLVEQIKFIKNQQGKNMVVWGSLSLAKSLIENNLIDEYHIQICPTVIGGGRQLFPQDFKYKNFNLIDVRTYSQSGVIYLHYEPKPPANTA